MLYVCLCYTGFTLGSTSHTLPSIQLNYYPIVDFPIYADDITLVVCQNTLIPTLIVIDTDSKCKGVQHLLLLSVLVLTW